MAATNQKSLKNLELPGEFRFLYFSQLIHRPVCKGKIHDRIGHALRQLAQTLRLLGVTLSRLFRNYNVPSGGAQLVKSGQGMEVVRRGTRSGHTYHLLAYDQGPHKTFEPFLITLQDPGEEFTAFEHPGTEFIHMLEGALEYRVGDETYLLEPGDSLTFRGEIPHRPEKMHTTPIRFLAIIHYDAPAGESDQENK